MAIKRQGKMGTGPATAGSFGIATAPDELLLAAMERGGDDLRTGRYLITYRDDAAEAAPKSLGALGLRVADARDFKAQAVALESVTGADALLLPEIGVAVVSGEAVEARGLNAEAATVAEDSAIEAVEPEYFVFSANREYLRGFTSAANAIAKDLGLAPEEEERRMEEDVAVLGATWGLLSTKVPPSARSGLGIKVAVLDTGFALGHPDFVGRTIVSQSFVGQPVQDLHGHGTHCIGTACGPKAPSGATPRYGIGYGSRIFAGKVLSNAGSSVGGSVLAGMNWAIANRCEVISMSLGSKGSPVSTAYTNAGRIALQNGCLIVAASGNEHPYYPTGAPANSPTILSVAALDRNLRPASFSCRGKVDIAAPGVDVFSAAPMPRRYATMSGTSMATPHVAGCAALWAQTSASLRGSALWRQLQVTAKPLPYLPSVVGAGLVQAPA